MKIDVRPRQAGKTYALVEWVREGVEDPTWPFWTRIIVTHSEDEARRIRRYYDLDDHQVFCFRDWQGRYRYSAAAPEIAIDNLDLILSNLGIRADIVTMTGIQR